MEFFLMAEKPTYDELKERVQNLESRISTQNRFQNISRALFKISSAVNTTPNLDELYKSIHGELSSVIDTTNFFIAIYNKAQDSITFPYCVDSIDECYPPVFEITKSESLAAKVIRTGLPLLITKDEILKQRKKSQRKIPACTPSELWLGVPLKIETKIIGIMAVQSYDDANRYDQTDLGVMVSVADQVALSIENKRSEKALRESEEKFRAIADTSPLAIYMSEGIEQKAVYINPTFATLFGYTIDEVPTADHWWPLAYPDKKYRKKISDEWQTKVTHAIATKSVIEPMEVVVTCKDGSQKNISWDFITIGKENWACGLDLTEQKKSEQALQESEKTFRALFEKGPIGVAYHQMVYDESGKPVDYLFLEANQSYQRLTGVNPVGRLVTEAFPGIEKDPFDWIGKFGEVAKTGKNFRAQNYVQTNDRWYDCVGYQYKQDHFVAAFLEITEHKKTEEALRRSEDLFKLITLHTSALVSIHDSDGNYIFASPSHEKLGYKPEDLIGQSGVTMIVEEDIKSLLKHLEKAEKKNISKAYFNYRIKDKKGKIHYYRGSFDGVLKANGSLEKIVCVGEDITELQKAQSEKEKALSLAAESEKLALVGQIAGKMAHDFNNILGVIMGNAELALIDCQEDGTKKVLELIYNQTIRGKNLTKNLVAFAKDQEPKQEFFSINGKLDLVINLLKKDIEGIGITREYGHDVPYLLADPGMIEHAIVNLVQNSIHATSLVEQSQIIIRTYKQDGRIFIGIEDNGCGIPQESLGEIFEPSFTLKGIKDKKGMYKSGIKGSGYGMSNVKKYVEQHKGYILVHSELKKGTKVTISLPIIEKELSVKEIEKIKQGKICIEKYILLVEDEQAISDVQYGILTNEPYNHKVDIAGNGQVAIDLFSRNEYDLISLDYVLPGGFSGMDVYHHIREYNKTIPILFISGNIEFLESIKDLKQKDSYIDHLSKPCANIDYLNCVNKLLGKLTT